MRRRHRGTDGGARGGLCTSNKSAGVLGGRERRRALFQTSPLIYLKLESCRANDGATTILRLPLPSRRRAILRSNSSACYLYLSNSGAHIRRDDFKRKLDVKKNSVFLARYLAQSQLNETAKTAGKTGWRAPCEDWRYWIHQPASIKRRFLSRPTTNHDN